jgi:hypothetical protein
MSKSLLFFIIGNVLLIALTYLTRKRRRLNNFVLLFTSFFFFSAIIEIAYRHFFGENGGHFVVSQTTFLPRPDPLLGSQPGKTGVFNSTELTHSGDTIYDVDYTIIADSDVNSFSFKHRIGYLNPNSPIPKLIFLGCSFTFGQGVGDSETLPYKAGSLQHTSTLNLGGVCYGIHHVYEIFMDKYANKDNKNKLFIYSMLPDHVLRASGLYEWSPGPLFKLVDDSLAYSGALPVATNRLAYYSSLFGCYSFLKDMVTDIEENERAKKVPANEYQKAYLMIRKMSQVSKATGGHFLLLFWDKYPQSRDPNLYYRRILEDKLDRLRKDSVDIIKVSDVFDLKDAAYFIPKDGHPSGMAYDTVAKYLTKYITVHYRLAD